MWIEMLLSLPFAPRDFSSSNPGFPLFWKHINSKFHFDQKSGRRRTTPLNCNLLTFFLFMFHEKILKKEIKIVDSYVLFFFLAWRKRSGESFIFGSQPKTKGSIWSNLTKGSKCHWGRVHCVWCVIVKQNVEIGEIFEIRISWFLPIGMAFRIEMSRTSWNLQSEIFLSK